MISKRHGFRGEVEIIRAKFRTLAKSAHNMKDDDFVKFPTWRELRQYFETMGKRMRRIWRAFEPLKYIRIMEKPFRWSENAVYVNAKEWNRQMKIPCCAQIVNGNRQKIAWRFPVFGGRLFLAISFGELRRNSYFQRIVNEEIIRQTFKYNFLIRNILIRGILVPSFQALTALLKRQGHFRWTYILLIPSAIHTKSFGRGWFDRWQYYLYPSLQSATLKINLS